MLTFLPPSSLCALMATGRSGCAAARLRAVWFDLVTRCAPFGPDELQVLHQARLTHDWLGFFKLVHFACRVKATVRNIKDLANTQLRLLKQEADEFAHRNDDYIWIDKDSWHMRPLPIRDCRFGFGDHEWNGEGNLCARCGLRTPICSKGEHKLL